MAYGDQPALICEMVDWCRTVGFDIVAAGKGTKYLPEYNYSTPDTVWNYYGFSDEQLASGDFNPQDVQLVPGRHQVRHRNGGRRERHGAHPAGRRPLLPAGRRGRPSERLPREVGRRHPDPARHRGNCLQPAPRRHRSGARPPLGRLRHLRGARPTTRRSALPSTGSRPTRPAATARCTARTT